MSKYPTLSDMDISRPEEITDYSIFTEHSIFTDTETNVLKIYYKRKEGSLLPRRKVFKFPMRSRPFVDTAGKQTSPQLREPSPAFLKAVAELEELLKDIDVVIDHKDQLLKRIEQLESEVKTNVAEIKSLLEKL